MESYADDLQFSVSNGGLLFFDTFNSANLVSRWHRKNLKNDHYR